MSALTPPRAINPRPNMTRRESKSHWARKWKEEVMVKRRLAEEIEHLYRKLEHGGDVPLWRIIINRIFRKALK